MQWPAGKLRPCAATACGSSSICQGSSGVTLCLVCDISWRYIASPPPRPCPIYLGHNDLSRGITMTRDRLSFFFLNLGHLYDHLFILLYATAVIGLEQQLELGYSELIALADRKSTRLNSSH